MDPIIQKAKVVMRKVVWKRATIDAICPYSDTTNRMHSNLKSRRADEVSQHRKLNFSTNSADMVVVRVVYFSNAARTLGS